MSVVSWMSAVEGCLLSGVPLYYHAVKWEINEKTKGVAYVPALLVASYTIVAVFSFKQPWLIAHREPVFVDTHPQINQVLLWLLFFSATNILTLSQISLLSQAVLVWQLPKSGA